MQDMQIYCDSRRAPSTRLLDSACRFHGIFISLCAGYVNIRQTCVMTRPTGNIRIYMRFLNNIQGLGKIRGMRAGTAYGAAMLVLSCNYGFCRCILLLIRFAPSGRHCAQKILSANPSDGPFPPGPSAITAAPAQIWPEADNRTARRRPETIPLRESIIDNTDFTKFKNCLYNLHKKNVGLIYPA